MDIIFSFATAALPGLVNIIDLVSLESRLLVYIKRPYKIVSLSTYHFVQWWSEGISLDMSLVVNYDQICSHEKEKVLNLPLHVPRDHQIMLIIDFCQRPKLRHLTPFAALNIWVRIPLMKCLKLMI